MIFLKGSRLNVQILSKINKTQSKKSINKARIIVRNLCFNVSNNEMKSLNLFYDLIRLIEKWSTCSSDGNLNINLIALINQFILRSAMKKIWCQYSHDLEM